MPAESIGGHFACAEQFRVFCTNGELHPYPYNHPAHSPRSETTLPTSPRPETTLPALLGEQPLPTVRAPSEKK